MSDYTYTDLQLTVMSKAELVALGVIHQAVAKDLPDEGTYHAAEVGGHIQTIPLDFERLMKDTIKSTSADAPDFVIVGRAMVFSGGRADPETIKKWLKKAVKEAKAAAR